MKNMDVDENALACGEYCQKRVSGCFCAVGWPPERQCLDCREAWERESFCECPLTDD